MSQDIVEAELRRRLLRLFPVLSISPKNWKVLLKWGYKYSATTSLCCTEAERRETETGK
jgi:hypothetical protein